MKQTRREADKQVRHIMERRCSSPRVANPDNSELWYDLACAFGLWSMRIFNSIQHHRLDIGRAAFTGCESAHPYIPAFGAHLFLSAEPEDVRKALEAGFAAATILQSSAPLGQCDNGQLRIDFDGDALLFSDESERIYKEAGLDALQDNEAAAAKEPVAKRPILEFPRHAAPHSTGISG